MSVFRQNSVNAIPVSAVDDGVVFAGVSDTLVDGFAKVNPVVEKLVYECFIDGAAGQGNRLKAVTWPE